MSLGAVLGRLRGASGSRPAPLPAATVAWAAAGGFLGILTVALTGAGLQVTLLLGALAVYSMLKVKTVANVLALEKIPAVAVANEVERNSLKTMYQTRGYAFTEETSYLDNARAELAAVKQSLREAAR